MKKPIKTQQEARTATQQPAKVKQYTFEEVGKIQDECRQIAQQLYYAMRKALPSEYHDALWYMASMQSANLYGASVEFISSMETICQSAKANEDVKKLMEGKA